MMPQAVRQPLIEQCRRARSSASRNLKRDGGYVPLPDSLRHKALCAAGLALAVCVSQHHASAQ